MFRTIAGRSVVVAMGIALFWSCATEIRGETKPSEKISYYKQIRPIFQAHCQGCHQPAKPKGKYVMTAFDKLLAGGESDEPAIVPHKPDESLLIKQITPSVKGEFEMPKNKKPLPKSEIALISSWIAQGAVDDTPANTKVRYDSKHPPVYKVPPVVTALDFSPDGKLLAVAGFNEVLLHKADGSGLVARLIGMSERIESVRFSPDGKLLAVSGGMPARSGELQIWDVEKRKLSVSVPVTYDTIYGARWSPDGKLVSFGCADNTVRVIEAKTGKQVLYQGAHNNWVLDTVFSVKGTHLISVSRDRSVKLIEVGTQRFIDNITSITPRALKGGIASVDRHPTKDEILVGGADGEPKLYRVYRTSKRKIGDDANLLRKFSPLKGRIFSVAISRDGLRIVAGSCVDRTGEVRIYTYDKAKMLAKTIFDKAGIFAVAFSPDGKTVAAAGTDGVVRLINADSGAITKDFVPVPLESVAKSSVAKQTKPPAKRRAIEVEKESLHPEEKIVSIEVDPQSLKIDHQYDTAQFVVTGRLASGELIDVTRLVTAKVSTGTVSVSPSGLLSANSNGRAEIHFTIGNHKAKAVVEVSGVEPDFNVDYIRDVMPIFAKAGCNAGTCHGAKKGKGGLKTSLRGNDPVFELRAFLDELASRRINLASPENSLLLLKASAGVPHEGGQTIHPDGPYYDIVRKWIADGALINSDAPRVDKIDIFPKNRIRQRTDGKQQYRVLATYTDGQVRDVTAESFISSGNIEVATADSTGLVSVLRRGETPVLARFEGRYAATTLMVMGDRAGFVWKESAANNFIDELIAVKLKRSKTLPSELCTDAEFIRRVYLDLAGLPPKADDVRKFLADKRDSKVKRDELIDRLVGSDDYVEHWTNKWADLLQVNRKFLALDGATKFRKWIRDQVAANTPYDKFAYTLLTASGSNRENPPASYFKILRTPENVMENSTHLFLAVRFNCNKCHDHPFERWGQNQYFETAAFFARVGLKKDPKSGKKQIGKTAVEKGKPLYEIVFDKKDGEVRHVETGVITPPKFPFYAKFDAPKDASRREKIARWMTSSGNRYFAKSYVNRLWGYLLGVGFIEPLDDIRAGNPPTNPELLDRLTKEFISNQFNVQKLLKTICKSRTYQMSIKTNKWNEDDTINYSHAIARRLPAEVLYDSLHRAVGSISRFPGVPPGTRAAQLPDVGVKDPSGFLAKFGRPPRESACECERATGMRFGPVMALVAGPTVGNAISDPKNEIAKLVASQKDDTKLIDELFLRILNRPATKAEIEVGLGMIQDIPTEHQHLVAELKKYESTLAQRNKAREKARQDAIATANKAFDSYKKQLGAIDAERLRKHNEQIAKRVAVLKEYEKSLPAKLTQWAKQQKKSIAWVALDPTELSATFGAKLTKEKDLSVFASGKNGKGSYKFVAHTQLQGITGIRLELFADKRLPKKGPGRGKGNGNFVLTEFRLEAAPKSAPKQKKPVELQNAKADFSQQGYPVASAIDKNQAPANNGWASSPKLGVNRVAVFETKKNLIASESSTLTFWLDQKYKDGTHSIGRFRISVTNSPRPLTLKGLPNNITIILALAADKRNDKQKTVLMNYFRGFDGELKKLQQALAESKKPLPGDPKIKELQKAIEFASLPLQEDPKMKQLQNDVQLSAKQLENPRLTAAQDMAWALINSPAFLFNR